MAKKEINKKDKEAKKVSKDKKKFGKDFKAELKKVVWPTPVQLAKSTLAVIAIVLVIVAIVFCLDFVFESMNKYGIDKIKEKVQTVQESDQNNTIVDGESNTVEESTNNSVENSVENVEE